MARGAWARVAVVASATIRAMSMTEESEPIDLDPFGLFKSEEPADDGRLPYTPEVLQAIQDSGKFG